MNTYAMATQVSAPSLEVQQKQYLSERASSVFYTKTNELYPKFGLHDEPTPKSPLEVIERIKAGDFVLRGKWAKDYVADEDDEDCYYYNAFDAFRWRKPGTKRDQVGFDKAVEALKSFYTKTKDSIMIGDAKEGLKALEAFESKTFH